MSRASTRQRMERVQASLFAPAVSDGPRWGREGALCRSCGKGAMRMVVPSQQCACEGDAGGVCVCRADGFAQCTACGEADHVWPRDMLPAPPAAPTTGGGA